VALADQAPTSARNKPKTPPDSKTDYVAAFFDSICQTRKSPYLLNHHICSREDVVWKGQTQSLKEP
jgi:hypothetical protein